MSGGTYVHILAILGHVSTRLFCPHVNGRVLEYQPILRTYRYLIAYIQCILVNHVGRLLL